jgi:amino acid permease
MMKKIKDERLIMKNLQNIRIAYIIQTIGILGILGYDLVTKGMDGMTDNPVWYVFIVTAIVSAYLSMNVNVDHENRKKDPKKGLYLSILIITVLSFFIGLLFINTDGYKLMNGVLIGGIIFICCLTPVLYTYYLRNKRERDIDEEE